MKDFYEITFGIFIVILFVFIAGAAAAFFKTIFGSSWWVFLLVGAPIGFFLIGD